MGTMTLKMGLISLREEEEEQKEVQTKGEEEKVVQRVSPLVMLVYDSNLVRSKAWGDR